MKKHRFIIIYLVVYLLLQLLVLQSFPFVHSDEPWLSGLSRNMAENGSVRVTETFFDLKPRFPHAIKTLYHLLQIPFLLVFGYQVFAFRLLSLLCGLAALFLFYLILSKATEKKALPIAGTILLSIDIQFIYASHFARQESLILLVMLAVSYLLLFPQKRGVLFAGILTGLSIGVHPNSFLVAAMGGALLVAQSIQTRKLCFKSIGQYVGIVSAFAAFFVALSFSFDQDFIRHYLSYGSEFQVSASLIDKVKEIAPYFQRLYYGVSGTYYTPNIRPQLLLFLGVLCASAILVFFQKGRKLLYPLFAILGILAGMTLIGRFNQPYVVFFFPFAYLLLFLGIDAFSVETPHFLAKAPIMLLLALVLLVGANAFIQIAPIVSQKEQYDGYLAEIASVVPKNAKTIGNLNAEYHFENGALLDYRNLPYLKEKELPLQEYIEQNGVEYLIISDELAFLHSLRPTWNGVYGNINFLEELNTFLSTRCTLLHSFESNQYGVRIVRYQNGEQSFTIRIYRYDGESG